jgi:hypothetical protein
VGDEGVREVVAEEAESRDLDRVPPLVPRVGVDRDDLRLEKVTRLGAPDEDRAGERMHGPERRVRDVGDVCGRRELAVERVARLVDDGVAGVDLDDRLDRLVPAVVAGLRLLRQRLRRVDRDHVLSWHRSPPRIRPGAGRVTISQSS